MNDTPAHTDTLTLRLVVAFPAHEPRESDPHYAAFHAARRRLEKLGALRCWIDNADCGSGPIELHHDKVEFALANDVDVVKFDEAYGLHLKDENEFLDYINGEEGLLPLCPYHHRGHGGIHCLPMPLWNVHRYCRDGVAAPARVASS